jgi:hypothetical protein
MIEKCNLDRNEVNFLRNKMATVATCTMSNYAYESLYVEARTDKSGSKAEKKEKTCQSNGIEGAAGADTPKANISRWEMERRAGKHLYRQYNIQQYFADAKKCLTGQTTIVELARIFFWS